MIVDNTSETKTLTEAYKQEIINIINNYAIYLEASNGQITSDLQSIYLSNDYIENTLHHAINDRYGNDIYDSDYIVNSELTYYPNYDINTAFTTTGQKLMEMGYDIVALDIANTLYFENHPDYEKAYPSYYCTMVKINDKWYIAEEINTHSRWSECQDLWILD